MRVATLFIFWFGLQNCVLWEAGGFQHLKRSACEISYVLYCREVLLHVFLDIPFRHLFGFVSKML